MADPQRLRGDEVSIRIVDNGQVLAAINAITTFNDSVKLQLKEQGYLGEPTNRFDDMMDGYGFDFEYHFARASVSLLVEKIVARATRKQPSLVFNVVRTCFYANGDSEVITYKDVKWGEVPTNISSRADYVKVRMTGGCSERPILRNQLP